MSHGLLLDCNNQSQVSVYSNGSMWYTLLEICDNLTVSWIVSSGRTCMYVEYMCPYHGWQYSTSEIYIKFLHGTSSEFICLYAAQVFLEYWPHSFLLLHTLHCIWEERKRSVYVCICVLSWIPGNTLPHECDVTDRTWGQMMTSYKN